MVPMTVGGHGPIVETLLASAEPSLRWKVRTQVLDEGADGAAIEKLREEICRSERVRGGASTRRANPWVTADALAVLRAAGRLRL